VKKIVVVLERVSERFGQLSAWLVLTMTVIIVYDVGMRYIFQQGSVALQELEWHLFALIFLLGAAYTLKHDSHVRLEIFYQHYSPRQKAWLEILGSLLLLLPFCVVVITASWPFVANAFIFNEGSPDPGGLPARYLLKAVIPISFILLFIQAIADIARNIELLCQTDKVDQ